MGLCDFAARMKSVGMSLVPWWTSWKKECCALVQGSPKRMGPGARHGQRGVVGEGGGGLPVVYLAGEPSEVMDLPLDSMESCWR